MSTCQWSFALRETSYLGYVISGQGMSTCLAKIQAVADWPQPTNVKDLESFLGLVGYYRKFVKNFGIISRPLTDLLKKHSLFCWTEEHEVAFQTLKLTLMNTPVLALQDFSNTFCIETNSSEFGVRDVLMQDHHLVAYIRKALGPKLRGLSTHEKEYIAILLAIDQWISYL
jgi:hypothetical protein